MSERDTHFRGFSKVLWDKMMALHSGIDVGPDGLDYRQEEEYKALIAQGAYDLAAHVVRHTGVQQYDPATGYESKSVEEVITRDVPDLTELPEQEE